MLARAFENWPYKAMALLFAVALHLYVSGQNPRKSRTLSVPLQPRGLSSGVVLDDKSLQTVTLTLEGASEELDRLSDANVAASVDLSRARAGKNAALPIEISLPVSARGVVMVAEKQPPTATVVLEARKRRRLPITATLPGTPPPGFAFRAPQISPREATVEGMESAVRSVAQLLARADGGNAVGSVEDDLPLVALDAQGAVVGDVAITPAVAHVQIDMARVPAMKTLLVSPTLAVLPAFPLQVTGVEVVPPTVTLAGRPESLARIGTVGTTPLDLSGATGDVVRQAACAPPPGLTFSGPSVVTVTVHIAAIPTPAPAVPAPASPRP